MAPVTEKAENKTISLSEKEVVDRFEQVIIITEHKIRNLEKRKRKVEMYKENQRKGERLNADQLLAVAKHAEVVASLEVIQDLRKQFDGVVTETAKQQKRQAKKEAAERAARELTLVRAVLTLQDVLQNMGVDEIREDFLAGRNAAFPMTADELEHLDEIYVEVFPKREEGSPPLSEQVVRAAEHLVAIVDGRNKEVVGTTYKKLNELLGKIAGCGYLERGGEGEADASGLDEAIDVERVEADMSRVEIGSGDGSVPVDKDSKRAAVADNKYAVTDSNGI